MSKEIRCRLTPLSGGDATAVSARGGLRVVWRHAQMRTAPHALLAHGRPPALVAPAPHTLPRRPRAGGSSCTTLTSRGRLPLPALPRRSGARPMARPRGSALPALRPGRARPSPTPEAPVTPPDPLSQLDTACPRFTLRCHACDTLSHHVTTPVTPGHPVTPRHRTPSRVTQIRALKSLKRESKRGAMGAPRQPGRLAPARAPSAVRLITSLPGWRPPKVLHGRIAAAIPRGRRRPAVVLEAWCTGVQPNNPPCSAVRRGRIPDPPPGAPPARGTPPPRTRGFRQMGPL